jgi:hypothetical protein
MASPVASTVPENGPIDVRINGTLARAVGVVAA